MKNNDLQEIKNQIIDLNEKFDRALFLLKNYNKFNAYPQWITAQQAMEILPFKSPTELSKWARRGVIEKKEASENGRISVYSKANCLEFPDRVEDWKIRGGVDPFDID